MKANRRTFFGLMGTVPLAAKATVDAEIAKNVGMLSLDGLGNSSIGYSSLPMSQGDYERSIIGATDYIKAFGIPAQMESQLRSEARHVGFLDPDLACKRSWSMSVKIVTQRQRNYQRSIERIKQSGWQIRSRATLKKLLGFDWPW